MKKITAIFLAAGLLLQNSPLLYAAEAALVNSVRVSADSVYISADKPVEYKAFMMDSPARLVLDISDSKLKTYQEIPVAGPATLRKVRTSQFQREPSVSRVVMELSQKAAYEVTRRGSELIVSFGARAAARVSDAPAAVKTPAPAQAGLAAVAAPAPAKAAAAKPVAAKPAAARVEPRPVEVSIEPADPIRASAPVAASAVKRRAASGRSIMENLSRDPISFDYNDADVREVMDMMAAKAGVNIIYSDDVSGTLTMSLAKVPFDEAFQTILNVKGLAAQQVGDNILRIASPRTLMTEQRSAMLQTRVFFLNYSRALDMKTQIDAVTSAENRTTGRCTTDDVNNAVIVTDTPVGLETTARLIRSLDKAPKQVLIEVKLIEVALVDEFDLGVNWSYASGPDSKGRYVGTMASGLPSAASAGGTGVDLAAKNIYGGLRFGKVSADSFLDMALTAAAKKGKAKVLSDPKVATLNNKEANINITSQVPYTTSDVTTTGGVSVTTNKVTYITTGIVLKVTPTITHDGRIAMKVNPSVSQPSATAGVAAPSVDTRSADTNVVVTNGETIVIGGLIHDTQSDSVTKVPLLGDIPLLGVLFRKKSVSRNRLELLIFVTPKIIED